MSARPMADNIVTVSRCGTWIGCALTVLVSGFVFWTFHDQFWYAPDEGNYAHVAQRVLSGEVLNRDVQDVHMGYINIANAGAMWLFGERLRSLRFPLIAIGVVSAAAAFWLTCHDNLWIGITAGSIVTTLSILQFLNPTAHWYCFGLVWVILIYLTFASPRSRSGLVVVGFLLGLIFLFRQLTGVLVAMGVLACLLSETAGSCDENHPDSGRSSRWRWGAPLLCGIMFLGLLGYLWAKTGGLTLLMYGSWPLALLAIIGWRTRLTARQLARLLGFTGIGTALAAAPLVVYHTVHGSIRIWLADTLFSAESLTRLDFIQSISFPLLLTTAWGELLSGGGLVSLLNSLFWIAALSAAPILGLGVVYAECQSGGTSQRSTPLVLIAVFYSIVSLHYQIPIYLFYSLSLTLVALLQIARLRREWTNAAVIAGLAMSVIGLRYHAAQPLTRGWDGILSGQRSDSYVACSNPRCGLAIPQDEEAVYREVCSLIDKQCTPAETILALPSNAEIYFLSGRRNPFRFFNSALELGDADDVRAAIAQMEAVPPRLVFHHPADKYNTPESDVLLEWVQGEYEQLPAIGEFDVYCHPTGSVIALDRIGAAQASATMP